MFKKLIPFAAAAALFFSAEGLQAQSGSGCCSKKKAAGECTKKQEKKAEETIRFSTITQEQLLQLMEEGVYVIDARGEESYKEGHIDGAVLFSNFTLPEDKDARMIFYCGGPKCSAAPKAARKTIDEGYTNVMVYHGGWMEWNEMASSQAGL